MDFGLGGVVRFAYLYMIINHVFVTLKEVSNLYIFTQQG